MATCDFCGTSISDSEMAVLRSDKVVSISKKGFIPSRLPFMDILRSQGVSPQDVWQESLSQNQGRDWGVCERCLAETRKYTATESQVEKCIYCNQPVAATDLKCIHCGAILSTHIRNTLFMMALGAILIWLPFWPHTDGAGWDWVSFLCLGIFGLPGLVSLIWVVFAIASLFKRVNRGPSGGGAVSPQARGRAAHRTGRKRRG